MSDRDFENKGSGNSSSFNWNEEKKAAIGDYDAKYSFDSQDYTPSYKPSADYRTSIFTDTQQSRGSSDTGSFSWPTTGSGDYKYDFPSDNDYVYSPQVDYDFSTPDIERRQERRKSEADGLNGYNRRSAANMQERKRSQTNKSRPNTEPDRRPNQKTAGSGPQTAKKRPPQKNAAKNSSSKALSKGGTSARVPASQKPKDRRQATGKNREANAGDRKKPLDFFVEKKQLEKQKRQEHLLEKNNRSVEQRMGKGESKDEILRSQALKKQRTTQFYAALCVTGVVLFVGLIALIFCLTRGFPIVNIIVEGSSTYSDAEILEAGGIAPGENMLRIRQKKTNNTLSTSLPYIDSVEVDWQLPDTLRLVITETTDKLLIVNGSKYICVDKSGKVVSDSKKKVGANEYKIEGFESQEYEIGKEFLPNSDNGNKKRYETVNKIIDALEKNSINTCHSINIKNLDLITLTCEKGVKIYVNEDMDFESRLALVAQRFTENPVSSSGSYYFDIRYGNQVVLKEGELEQP